MNRRAISGWGRYPRYQASVADVRSQADVLERIASEGLIARGNGRAYGDSAVNTVCTLNMRRFDRLLAFDAATGVLVAESGVLLGDIIKAFLPRGWFPAVTPGTKFVTIGGMIAANVHGKNHHRDGGMRQTVEWFDLCCADGEVRRCSRLENKELFDWTIGGMGLTGVILRAAIRLLPVESGWIKQTIKPASNLADAMRIFEEAQEATYSVAWIDCYARASRQGRSIVMLGEHARLDEVPAKLAVDRYATKGRRELTMPMDLPQFALNKITVKTFNAYYYWSKKRSTREDFVSWDSYFYPLDAILEWNKIYGRKGFAQFQCVLPLETASDGLKVLLDRISKSSGGSFLAVLKKLGAADPGLSFPMPGYTLALDFPISSNTLRLLDDLDEITIAHAGRFYLAKDARMKKTIFDQADERGLQIHAYRDQSQMLTHFLSAQSERLGL